MTISAQMRNASLAVLLGLGAMVPTTGQTALTASDSTASMLAEARTIEASIDAGRLDEAQAALGLLDAPELVRTTLHGRLALARGDTTEAERRFAHALALAPDHLPLRVLLAHARLASGRHRAVLEVLDHPGLSHDEPALAILAAAAHEGLSEPERAYVVLERAATLNPRDVAVRRELVLLCARNGLFEAARRWAGTPSPDELGRDVLLATLTEIRGHRGAQRFAEWFGAAFPSDAEIHAQIGWVYSSVGELTRAARSFERATVLGADLGYIAAEHHRAAGNHRAALRMNAHVPDVRSRLEQRFDILFESGAMARAIALGQRLEREHGVSNRRRYNLAYALYSLGQHAEATEHARRLAATDEAGRAQALLRAMGRE